MKVRIRKFRAGDEAALLRRGLRASDIREAWKVGAVPPDIALHLTLATAQMAASVFIGGRIAAILGVSAPLIADTGAPWLVAHADFENPRTAVCMGRICRRFLNRWLTVFRRLENYADPEHAAGLRFLRRLGFTLAPAPVTGPLGHTLIYFWRESSCASV